MKYVVLGAGAIGATVGGLLADAGHAVALVARGAHAAQLRGNGLQLLRPDRSLKLQLPVVVDPSELSLDDGDVLLLATKSQHSAEMLTAASAAPGAASATVVCLQNGIVNERLALRCFDRVIGCCVMLPASLLEPGVVTSEALPMPGILTLGRPEGSTIGDEQLGQVSADLESAGFVAPVVADVMAWKRAKLLGNLSNVLDALTGDNEDEQVEAIYSAARAEGEAVFQAAGLSWIESSEWTAGRRGMRIEPVEGQHRGGSSSWQSLARGSSLETDYLNGEIALLARLHGTSAPVNAALQRAAALTVSRGDGPGSWTPEQLVAAVSA